MARLWSAGAEIEAGGPGVPGYPDGEVVTGTVTRDTGTFRSGVAAWKCDSTGANVKAYVHSGITATITSKTVYGRVYINASAAPSTAAVILGLALEGGNDPYARFRTDGAIELFVNSAAQGSPSPSVADGLWHRLELSGTADASSNWTGAELRVDGVSVATWSGSVAAGSAQYFRAGWMGAPGASKVIYLDDAAYNDSSGAVNNSWCGDGNVILMQPISDNARGNWTAGAGGTTNLWDAVNNTPPVGVADSSATNTSQIKIKSTSLPSNCDLNLDTYTNAGVTAGATVNAVTLWVNDGEDPTTGTKAGTAAIVSNPSSGTVSFNFGDDVGAQGTYTGNWKWHSKLVDAPSVTLGTAPVVRVTCSSGSTGTRAASCDFLGVYVDYTPVTGETIPSLVLARR